MHSVMRDVLVGASLATVACGVGSIQAAGAELATGEIVERVRCEASPEHSYALFLPSAYDVSRKWPVIYAFSPGGGGRLPVELLQLAAEAYGYIVVGSHDVANGPWEPIFAAQRAMWRDVNKRFSVDPRRSYATGFSGGARASVEMALEHRNRFAGLILCGGVFSPLRVYPDGGGLMVVGLVGDGDLNLEEHVRAREILDRSGYPQWQEIFDGSHQWPDAELFQEAVELLEIDAMCRGLMPRDRAFEERTARQRLEGGRELRRRGQLLLARSRLCNVATFFAETEAGQTAAQEVAELERGPEMIRLSQLEEDYLADLAALNDWREYAPFREAAKRLGERVRAGGDLGRRSRLALHLISIYLDRAGVGLLTEGKAEEALPTLHIAASVYPPNAVASYNAACAFALTGDGETALELLRSAARNGFDNVELISADTDLSAVRDRPEMKAILGMVQENRDKGTAPPQYPFGPRQPR